MNVPEFGLCVIASDIAATRTFYETYFNFDVRMDIGWFVTMGRGESSYELSIVAADHESVPLEHPRSHGGAVLGIMVPDAAAIHDKLKRDGVTFMRELVDEPFGQRHFYVSDPAGFLIDCIQLIEPDPAWMASIGSGSSTTSPKPNRSDQ